MVPEGDCLSVSRFLSSTAVLVPATTLITVYSFYNIALLFGSMIERRGGKLLELTQASTLSGQGNQDFTLGWLLFYLDLSSNCWNSITHVVCEYSRPS